MILNEENIVEYEKGINSNFEDTIKQSIIDRINLKYSNLLETNRLTTDLIDDMTSNIKFDDTLTDFIDSLVDDEIENTISENNLLNIKDRETIKRLIRIRCY